MSDFTPFPKVPRLFREISITEKIDGTNACVDIREMNEAIDPADVLFACDGGLGTTLVLRAGSRSRWLRPTKTLDNYGFAAWVEAHAEALTTLGVGQHFGEWWGKGIGRNYGIDHRRFSLFNVDRWADHDSRPSCCDVVPELYTGEFTTAAVCQVVGMLRQYGSDAVPSFMKPEGVMVFHRAAQQLFKVTLENDELPKGRVPEPHYKIPTASWSLAAAQQTEEALHLEPTL